MGAREEYVGEEEHHGQDGSDRGGSAPGHCGGGGSFGWVEEEEVVEVEVEEEERAQGGDVQDAECAETQRTDPNPRRFPADELS